MDRRTSIRSSALLVALAILVLGVTFAANADDLDEVSAALKCQPQAQFARYYVALDQGVYQEEGLLVAIIPGETRAEPQDLVAAGIAQVFQSSGVRYIPWAGSGFSRPLIIADAQLRRGTAGIRSRCCWPFLTSTDSTQLVISRFRTSPLT